LILQNDKLYTTVLSFRSHICNQVARVRVKNVRKSFGRLKPQELLSKKGVQQKVHELFSQEMHMLCTFLDVTHDWAVNVIRGGRGRRGSSERGSAKCWVSLLA
jgi:hypothetical protein